MIGGFVRVDFLDLKRQYHSIKKEIDASFLDTMEENKLILGPKVEKFEKEFAEYALTKHCLGLNSGTTALYFSLLACGVGSGDEVITASNSFIATAIAISLSGARPIFVDLNDETFNLDASLIEAKISRKTKAIIPVHLYGQPADMDTIISIAKKHKLFVIEDACQAHGAEYNGKRVGSFGDISAFSFYPGKNLGAYGDGGAIVTNNPALADKVFMLRNYGQRKKYYHDTIGINDRLDSMQAGFLSIKLKYLDQWNEMRLKNARIYDNLFKGSGVRAPVIPDRAKPVFHLYVVRSKKRDALQNYLRTKGIITLIHYPVPIHLQKAYESLGLRTGSSPKAEQAASEVLSLPMFPELTPEEIKYVSENVIEFENGNK